MKKLNKLIVPTAIMLAGVSFSMTIASAQEIAGTINTYFVPMEKPCRLFDTRKTSRFVAGETRDFFIYDGGELIVRQGGDGGGRIVEDEFVADNSLDDCVVATGSVGVNLSISAVKPDGKGFLRAWPRGKVEPRATLMNWNSINDSKSISVAFNPDTLADLTIKVYESSVDLVGDVVGYYMPVN